MPPTLTSALLLSTFGLGSKAFLNFASKGVRTEGLEHLLKALQERPIDGCGTGKRRALDGLGDHEDEKRGQLPAGMRRRGIVTICNHTSVVDDPMAWGVMPLSTFFPFATPRHTSRWTRWTLGASDIMFTNRFFSSFFRTGQVIETVRGGGIFQPAIDEAVRKVQEGEWIHIFPEGLVNQRNLNPPGGLRRFKWGVSRIIMDSEVMPEVIPIWLSGFDEIMPDTRKYLRFFPRPGHRASVTIGRPITSLVEPIVAEWKRLAAAETSLGRIADGSGGGREEKGLGIGGRYGSLESDRETEELLSTTSDAQTRVDLAETAQPVRAARAAGDVLDGKEKEWRIRICDVLWEELRTLGREVEEREGKDRANWRNAVPRDGAGGYDPAKRAA